MSITSPFLRHVAPRLAALAGIAALAAGCGSVVVIGPGGPGGDAGPADDAPIVQVDVQQPPGDRVTPRTCTRSSDCGPGQECTGGQGCGVPWTCGPALGRPCTDDLAPFCGCDGVTFNGSSTCPDRPWAFRGPCEAPPPPPPDGGTTVCALPDGRVCPVGQRCPLTPCTYCVCTEGAGLRCVDTCPDAGSPPPPPCRLPNGELCAAGQTCPIDRCTICFCGFDGQARCASNCLPDAGTPRACTDSSQCPGTICTGPEGCGTRWTCATGPVGCTADLAPFCGCDGVTFYGSSSCPGRPYSRRGACATPVPDAGPRTCNIRGTLCPVGAECAIDRCTVCRCDASGSVACRTLPGCSIVDAGPATCSIRGITCVVGQPCLIDRCTVCTCFANGATTCGSNPECIPDAGAIDAGSIDAGLRCDPMDARGEGLCDLFLGYAWNGTTCVGQSGCRCTGADCGRLFRDPRACIDSYAACLPRP